MFFLPEASEVKYLTSSVIVLRHDYNIISSYRIFLNATSCAIRQCVT